MIIIKNKLILILEIKLKSERIKLFKLKFKVFFFSKISRNTELDSKYVLKLINIKK